MSLQAIREKLGMSRDDLAKHVGISVRAIQSYEYGVRRPSPAVAERIAKALGMDVATMWAVLYRPSDGSFLSDISLSHKI